LTPNHQDGNALTGVRHQEEEEVQNPHYILTANGNYCLMDEFRILQIVSKPQ